MRGRKRERKKMRGPKWRWKEGESEGGIEQEKPIFKENCF